MKIRKKTTAVVDDGPVTAETVTATELRPELAGRREVAAAYRDDAIERERADARHDRDRQDVAEEVRQAERARAEREEQSRANAELARMYRTFRATGERTRITSQMARSGEARALRLERLRTLNLKVLVPVLLGFAAWSTTGVHHGAARLMGVGNGAYGDPMWWALWLLEPVLIGAVVWILIVRARLASAGGTLNARAEALAIGCLGTSVLLNFSAAIPTHALASTAAGFGVAGAMLAHAVGPAGAAATAHLIGVVDESIAGAEPWTDKDGRPVPLLADMDFDAMLTNASKSTSGSALESASESTAKSALDSTLDSAPERPAVAWPLPIDGRTVLPVIARPKAPKTTRRTGGDQDGQGNSKAARPTRTTRPNKGVPVPPSARKSAAETSPRALSDEELRTRLDALITSGELSVDAPVRQVQTALGISFNRAKRVMRGEANEPMPGQLTVAEAADRDDEGDEDESEAAA